MISLPTAIDLLYVAADVADRRSTSDMSVSVCVRSDDACLDDISFLPPKFGRYQYARRAGRTSTRTIGSVMWSVNVILGLESGFT